MTVGVALSSGYLLTVVSFSPALAATPNSVDRAGFEPAHSEMGSTAELPIRWPSLRPVTAPQFALATPEAMPQQGGDRLLPLQYQWVGRDSNPQVSHVAPDLQSGPFTNSGTYPDSLIPATAES